MIAVPIAFLVVVFFGVVGWWLYVKLMRSPRIDRLTKATLDKNPTDTPRKALDEAVVAKAHVAEKRDEAVAAQAKLKRTEDEMTGFLGDGEKPEEEEGGKLKE